MRDAWNVILTRYQDYFSGSGFGVLFVLCLIGLYAWRRKDKAARNALFWPWVLLLAVIFCPVSAYVIMKLIGHDVYWRVFWLLPVVLVIAVAGTELVSCIGGKGKKLIAVLLCFLLIAVNGKFVFSHENFQSGENQYKLPAEVIRIADAINEHAKENKIKKKKIVAPINIATYIRIYDASIYQRYGRNMIKGEVKQTQLYYEINSDTPDYELLSDRVRVANCRYVVINQEADDKAAMEALDFELVFEGEAYNVYFNLDYEK